MDLKQVKAERFDPRQYAVERGLVRQGAGQYRVVAVRLGAQGGERGAHRAAKAPPDADLVPHLAPRAKRETENRPRAASSTEKISTAVNVPVNSESTPMPTTGMISPA